MYKNTEILLLAFTTYSFYPLSGEESRKTFFTDISDDLNKEGQISSIFHKTFHHCTIAEDCNFVTKNIKTNKFKEIFKESDLPVDRENYKVWKKQEIVNVDKNGRPWTERGKNNIRHP